MDNPIPTTDSNAAQAAQMANQLVNQQGNGQQAVYQIDPSQTRMFEGAASKPANQSENYSGNVTHLEINHELEGDSLEKNQPMDDKVNTSTKVKVLAALAIVAVAGYVAYWVQEPVQLKADVLGADKTSSSESTNSNTTKVADNSPVGANDSTTIADSKNIDVSLFGFEPAVLKINKGTTVIWTNTSSEDQTIIGLSPNGDSFTSTVLTSGQTFSHKFDKDGDYQYYSTYNPALKANLTVGLGNSDTTTSSTTNDQLKPAAADESNLNNLGIQNSTASNAVIPENQSKNTLNPENTNLNNVENVNPDGSGKTLNNDGSITNSSGSTDQLKPAANLQAPNKLSKTGPEDLIYLFALMLIAYFNRKKLATVLK